MTLYPRKVYSPGPGPTYYRSYRSCSNKQQPGLTTGLKRIKVLGTLRSIGRCSSTTELGLNLSYTLFQILFLCVLFDRMCSLTVECVLLNRRSSLILKKNIISPSSSSLRYHIAPSLTSPGGTKGHEFILLSPPKPPAL